MAFGPLHFALSYIKVKMTFSTTICNDHISIVILAGIATCVSDSHFLVSLKPSSHHSGFSLNVALKMPSLTSLIRPPPNRLCFISFRTLVISEIIIFVYILIMTPPPVDWKVHAKGTISVICLHTVLFQVSRTEPDTNIWMHKWWTVLYFVGYHYQILCNGSAKIIIIVCKSYRSNLE